jgi:ElaB/YqjD/DUF883 family membrane-anchored ribosome-binding protein
MKQAEEMCVVLEAQMEDLRARAEELLTQKDDDAQQEIEQIRAKCRDELAEQQEDAEKANAKIKRKLRDSGGYVVELLEKIRQLEAENEDMKFADCKSESDRMGLSLTSGLASNPANREIASSSGASEHQDIFFFDFFSIFF